jgi:tetratricopeptide (TPR) repeat protein
MKRTLAAILASTLLATGCARQQQPATRSTQSTDTSATATTTTAPNDPALLTLDQIEPKPVLRDLVAAAAATRPATTRPATRPAEPPLEALYIYARARAAQVDGDRRRAIDLLEKALRLDPDSFALNYALGLAHLGGTGGANDRALAALERAAAINPDDLDVQLTLGRQYFTRNDLPRTIHHLRLALQTAEYRRRADTAALVNLFLGRALQQTGYDTAALEQYEILLRKITNRTNARSSPELFYLLSRPEVIHVQVGELHEKRGRFDAALAAYRRAADGQPNNIEYQARIVRTLLKLRRAKEARELAADLVGGHRASPQSVELLKEVYKASSADADVAHALRDLMNKRGGDRSIAFALAEVLASTGREADAERLLLRVLDESKRSPTVVLRLFEFYTDRGRTPDAARLLVETIAHSPDSLDEIESMWTRLTRTSTDNRLRLPQLQALQVATDASAAKLFMVSRLAEQSNRDSVMRTSLEQAVAIEKPFAPAYRALLQLNLQREDWPEERKAEFAQSLIDRAKARSDDRLAAELRGIFAFHQKKVPDAIAAFRDAARLGSQAPGMHYALAMALYADDKDQEAEQLLWKITSDWPTYDESYLTLFRRYVQQGSGRQAMKVLDTWLAADPFSVNARLLQASVFTEGRRFEAAESALNALLRDEPDNPLVLAEMNRYYARMGKLDAFVAKLEEQRERTPDNPVVVDFLIRLHVAQQRANQATRVIEEMHKAVAADPDQLYFVAHLYERIDRRDTTEQVLRDVLRLDPQYAPANNDLGYMWADDGKNLDEAETMIRHAVEAEPDNMAYLDSLGWVLYKRGKFDEARQRLDDATKSAIDPDPVVLDHLGDVLYRLEARDEAAKTWHRSLERLGTEEISEARAELRKLQLQLKRKLRQLESGEPVNVAPIVETKSETRQQAKN